MRITTPCLHLKATFQACLLLFLSTLSCQVLAVSAKVSISPSTIEKGESAKVTWSSSGASSCTYLGSSWPKSGSATVKPSKTTKYKLTCYSSSGATDSDTATLKVVEPQPSVSADISPSSIYTGQTATLTWNSSNATSCNYGGKKGSVLIGPYSTSGKRSVKVTCTGPGGSKSRTRTLTVLSYPKPSMNFSVSPSVIGVGDYATWSWSSTNADYCKESGYVVGATGSLKDGPYNTAQTKTVTGTCYGKGGTVSKTIQLKILPAPNVMVSLSPDTVETGQSAVLSWDSDDATSCNYGDTSGTTKVGPFTSAGNRNFTVTCTGKGGTTSKTKKLKIVDPPPSINLTLTPESISEGGYVTWSWSTKNADYCELDGNEYDLQGSQVVGPYNTSMTKTFTAICTGTGGTVLESITLIVEPRAVSDMEDPQPSAEVDLKVNPVASEVEVNQSATISLYVQNTDECEFSGSFGSGPYPENGGSIQVSHGTTGEYQYTVTCADDEYGSFSDTIYLLVLPSGFLEAPELSFVSVNSGQNELHNNEITIRQDEELQVEWHIKGPVTCDLNGVKVQINGDEAGSKIVHPKYYFAEGSMEYEIDCGAVGYNSFTLTVLPPTEDKPLYPVLYNVYLKNSITGQEVADEGRFPQDSKVILEWESVNTSFCFLNSKTYSYEPENKSNRIVLEPYYFDVGFHQYEFFCYGYGGGTERVRISFEVTEPENPLGIIPGFDGEYEAYVGNINDDSKPDILISPIPGNESSGVAEFVLVSTPKGYSITGPQGVWEGVASGIELIKADFDADGLEDLMIKNIAGADDVIAYAPENGGAVPRDYVVVDQGFRDFFDEYYHQLIDPDYFDKYTYEETISDYVSVGYGLWEYCPWAFSYAQSLLCDSVYGDWLPNVVINEYIKKWKIVELENGDIDYREFHEMTNEVRKVLPDILSNSELISGSYQAAHFAEVMGSVLGRPYMGNVLAVNDGSLLDDELSIPGGLLGEYRFDKAMFSSLSLLWNIWGDDEKIKAETIEVRPSNSYDEFTPENFELWTGGLTIEEVQDQYEALTNSRLSFSTLEILFKNPALGETILLEDKNLHTVLRTILNQNIPETLFDVPNDWEVYPLEKAVFHAPWKGNIKVVGPYGRREAIYDEGGNSVLTGIWKGAFNFYNASTNPNEHRIIDVELWIKNGFE